MYLNGANKDNGKEIAEKTEQTNSDAKKKADEQAEKDRAKKKMKIKRMTKLKNQMKTLTKTVIQATQIMLLKIVQTKVTQIQTQIVMKIVKATKIKTVRIA
ncbi:hypothetical protein NIT60_12735 [Mammaliicoccus sciuri]|nr:hypothetical protein NIT60_12735 [Mammaliicoccus sciuri]